MDKFSKLISREGTSALKLALKSRFGRDDLVPLWVADMDFTAPECISRAVQKRAAHPIYGYTYPPQEYYDLQIDWLKARHNWDVEENWIHSTPGVVPALGISVLAFTEPGDQVIIQPPIYPPFYQAVKNSGRVAVDNQLVYSDGKYQIDFDDFEQKAKDPKTSLFLLCSPHNPSSRSWTKEELQKLAEICLDNNVLIISDELHCDLVLSNSKHQVTSMLSEEVAANTVTTVSASKTFNLSGLSCSAVIISNPKLQAKFKKVLESMHLYQINLFAWDATVAAYQHGEPWRQELLTYIEGNFALVDEFLKSKVPEIKLVQPEATYLGWLDCKDLNLADQDLHKFFINEAKVAFSEGRTFGPGGAGFERINVATSCETVQQGLDQIESAVAALR